MTVCRALKRLESELRFISAEPLAADNGKQNIEAMRYTLHPDTINARIALKCPTMKNGSEARRAHLRTSSKPAETEANKNEKGLPTMGNPPAHHGQPPCPPWATPLPTMGNPLPTMGNPPQSEKCNSLTLNELQNGRDLKEEDSIYIKPSDTRTDAPGIGTSPVESNGSRPENLKTVCAPAEANKKQNQTRKEEQPPEPEPEPAFDPKPSLAVFTARYATHGTDARMDDAREWWRGNVKTAAHAQEILTGLDRFVACDDWQPHRRIGIPHAFTFLAKHRYREHPRPAPPAKPGAAPPVSRPDPYAAARKRFDAEMERRRIAR